MFFIIGVLVFLGLGVLVLALLSESQSARVQERLQGVQQSSRVIVRGTTLDAELSKSLFHRVILPAVLRLRDRALALAPTQMVERTRARLDQAGNPPHLSVATFVGVRVLALAAGTFGGFLVATLWDAPVLTRVSIGLCVMAAGLLGPEYMLDGQIRSRQNRIRKSLPDMIDLLVVSTEAGTGLDGAMTVVIKRKQGPLPDEFSRVLTEMRLGKSRQHAWADMGDRVGLPELNMLIAALRQAEQLGVSVANTLRTQADALRMRRSMQIRQVAATLSTKLLFPLIFCILPAMFIVVMGPGLMSITGGLGSLGW